MIHDDKQKMVAEGDSAGEASTPMLDIDFNDDVFQAMMPPMQTENTLEDVALMAVTSGSTAPLVKEELRCAIQLRLLSAGKELSDTSSETSENVPSHGLSVEEEEKRSRRRDRNREAAQRCRKRKRDLADCLQVEVDQLELRNKELKSAVEKLLDEKSSLMTLLKRHDKSTQCDARLSTS